MTFVSKSLIGAVALMVAAPAVAIAGYWLMGRGPQERITACPFHTPVRDPFAHAPNPTNWLKAQQASDGSWDADAYFESNHRGPHDAKEGAGRHDQDIAVTSLAILALLSESEAHRASSESEAIHKGLSWLMQQQDPVSGFIGTRAYQDSELQHALACLAFSDAFRLMRNLPYKEAATQGLRFHENRNAPVAINEMHGQWAWTWETCNQFAWYVLASAAGESAGLYPSSSKGFAELRGELCVLYSSCGGPSHPEAKRIRRLNEERIARKRMFVDYGMGAVLHSALSGSTPLTSIVNQIAAQPPTWNSEDQAVDFARLYFSCLALQQHAGPQWLAWGNDLSRQVFSKARLDGAYQGSYDPIGRDCVRGGRIYATALVLLMQSTYYRYSKLTGAQ